MKALVALFAAVLCTAAIAGDEYEGNDKSTKSSAKFEALDTNQDQRLSRSELQAEESLAAEFASIDQDSDGYVSKSEFTAFTESSESRGSRGSRDMGETRSQSEMGDMSDTQEPSR